MKIFVDDERSPVEDGWTVVRSFMPFVDLIDRVVAEDILLTAISFDHDLGEDGGTGMECLKVLIEAGQDDPFVTGQLDEIIFHSANPIGVDNMRGLCLNAQEHGIIPEDVKLIVRSSLNTTGWAQMSKEPQDEEVSLDEIGKDIASLLSGVNQLSGDMRKLTELRKKKMISDVPSTQALIDYIEVLERQVAALRLSQVPISNDEDMIRFITRYQTSRHDDDPIVPFEGGEEIIRHVIAAINYRARYELNNTEHAAKQAKARVNETKEKNDE